MRYKIFGREVWIVMSGYGIYTIWTITLAASEFESR